jgi:hypothetical protein
VVRFAQGRRPFLRDGFDEDGSQVGSVLAGACLHMKDWDRDGEGPSLALRIESAALLIAWFLTAFFVIASLIGPPSAEAHPGGLAADGCHNDRQHGGRHCHRGPSTAPSAALRSNGSVYYPNCVAARAAGAAPIYRGQPGYGSHLDRDGDGKACE